MKGAVSAQKALQGSEMAMRELLGGTDEKRVSLITGPWFAFIKANQLFLTYLAPDC